jgi:hypothetical protein
MAPHVRKAVAAVQTRPAPPAPRAPAPHVQAAVSTVQMRPAPAALQRAAAPHVQSAVAPQRNAPRVPGPAAPHVRAAVAQPKPAGSPGTVRNPARVPPQAARPAAPVLQRKIIDSDLDKVPKLKEAYRHLREALKDSNTRAEVYFNYAASPKSRHDLVFRVINDEEASQEKDHEGFLGKTTFVYGDDEKDVTDDFDAARAVKTGINTVVVVNVAKAKGTVEEYLQTLSHEIGVHALEWFDLIVDMVGKKDAERLAKYFTDEFTVDGKLSAVTHHELLGKGKSKWYNEITGTVLSYYERTKELSEKQEDIFYGTSESALDRFMSNVKSDRYNHNEEEQKKSFQVLMEQIDNLNTNTPLIPKRVKKKEPSCCSCTIL